MKRKTLIPIITLLALSMMVILPAHVKAITKEPFFGFVTYTEWRLGESYRWWITEDGVMHEMDYYWSGIYFDGSLGTGIGEFWYQHWTYDPATGEMSAVGKWWLTIPDMGTIEGSWVGHGGYGTLVAIHGTDGFEGAKIRASFVVVEPGQFYMTGTISWT